jgi:hypothetical protein
MPAPHPGSVQYLRARYGCEPLKKALVEIANGGYAAGELVANTSGRAERTAKAMKNIIKPQKGVN